ncbi:hypothetical protein LIER_23250 [Lithospermum erythrorhizon]|uniref:Uncharacterized protein n=1 Tax=Lithospermum erythrorhizon TaxID=34254 RepID=A0AAV3QWQ7_LITER
MATVSNTQMNTNSSLPPRRGQIKEQIYENILDMMVSATTKAGEVLGMKKNEAGSGGEGGKVIVVGGDSDGGTASIG